MNQKQVEAAAKAICRTYFGDVVTHGDARCCQVGGLDGCCLKTLLPVARAALRAAASVSKPKSIGRSAIYRACK